MKQRKQRGFIELDYRKACQIERDAKIMHHVFGHTYHAACLLRQNGFTLAAALWLLLGRV